MNESPAPTVSTTVTAGAAAAAEAEAVQPSAPSRPRVTIRDVARLAGVSKTTVSHVLSGNRPVSSGTRHRVECEVVAAYTASVERWLAAGAEPVGRLRLR